VYRANDVLVEGEFYKFLGAFSLSCENGAVKPILLARRRNGTTIACHYKNVDKLVVDQWYVVWISEQSESLGNRVLCPLCGLEKELTAAAVLLDKGLRPPWL